jgi:hypothetical protein
MQAAADIAIRDFDFAEVGKVVYWHPPRFRGTRDQHLWVKSSSGLSALERPVPVVFEVPSHHSLPSAALACELRFQTSNLGIEHRSCFQMVQEENLAEMEIVLVKVS